MAICKISQSSIVQAKRARRHARLALEVAAEGGLLVEAEHVGDGLHTEVVANMEQHLGFGDDFGAYPIGGGMARFLLDD